MSWRSDGQLREHLTVLSKIMNHLVQGENVSARNYMIAQDATIRKQYDVSEKQDGPLDCLVV